MTAARRVHFASSRLQPPPIATMARSFRAGPPPRARQDAACRLSRSRARRATIRLEVGAPLQPELNVARIRLEVGAPLRSELNVARIRLEVGALLRSELNVARIRLEVGAPLRPELEPGLFACAGLRPALAERAGFEPADASRR